MSRISYSRLKEIFEQSSVDNERYSAKYNMMDIADSSVYFTETKTALVTVRAVSDIVLKTTGETLSLPFNVVKVPHFGSNGYIINGKNKQLIDLYERAKGWYIEKTKDDSFILVLRPDRGSFLRFEHRNLIMYVQQQEGINVPKVEVSVFLKALTGKTFSELQMSIGVLNEYMDATFSIPEPTRSECVDKVISNLGEMFTNYLGRGPLPNLSDKLQRISSTLTSPGRFYLGGAVFSRFIQSTSFSMRCKGSLLAEDLTVNGIEYFKGTFLNDEILEMFDYSEIDSLKVRLPDDPTKIYTILKKVSYNFRVCGQVLAEDIEISDTSASSQKIPAGTKLTVAHIKMIENINRDHILLFNQDETSTRKISRRKFANTFNVNDFIGMLQVYMEALTGLRGQDDTHSLMNQVVLSVESMVRHACMTQISIINREIENHLDEVKSDNSQTLLERLLLLKGIDEDRILSQILDSDSRQTQTADLNNSLQKMSQDHRMIKNVGRSSAEMSAVQDDQAGLTDPIENPESNKIGMVHNKAYYAKTNSLGFLCAAYVRVMNGEFDPSAPPVYLDANSIRGAYIAEWNETFKIIDPQTGQEVKKKKVKVRRGSAIMEVPVETVFYKEYSPYQYMSPVRMQVAFQEHSVPKRILMAINHLKQSHVLIKNRRALVSSGGDSLVCEEVLTAKNILEQYYDSNLITNFNKEEFCDKEIRLINAVPIGPDKRLFFEVTDMPEIKFYHTIPFVHKSGGGKSLFGYRVNGSTGGTFSGDDLVAYSRDVDVRNYEIRKFADFGGLTPSDKTFERAIGVSTNLVVGYKTHASSTMDDSFVISSRLLGMDTLTSMALFEVSYELKPELKTQNRTKKRCSFGLMSSSSQHVEKLGQDGIPKVGTKIGPGDPVIGYIVKEVASNNDIIKVYSEFIRYENNEMGEVIASSIKDNKAVVYIAAIKCVEEGDKLAGKCGNKGVIGKIVPEDEMPFDPITGVSLDIVASPLGVPSRSNLTQLLEGVVGYSSRKQGKVTIVTPYYGNTLDVVREDANNFDVHPMMLRDGKTGKYYERPINVAVEYFLRLEHMVSYKENAIPLESGRDQIYYHPKDGQAFGEMETWCLGVSGADKVLQDLLSIHSDDLESVSEISQLDGDSENVISELLNLSVDGENNNDQILKAIVRALGAEITYHDSNFSLYPLTDELTMSLGPRIPANKGHLRSGAVFGSSFKNYSKSLGARDRWAYVDLKCKIIHPTWIEKGKLYNFFLVKSKKSKSVEPIGMSALKDLALCRKGLLEVEGQCYVVDKIEGEGVLTGFTAIEHLVSRYDADEVIAYYKKARDSHLNAGTASSLAKAHKCDKILQSIKVMQQENILLSDYFITKLPILPMAFRPEPFAENQVQDFDHYYTQIFKAIEVYSKDGSVRFPTEQEKAEVFCRIAHLCGWGLSTSGEKVELVKKSILRYFSQRNSEGGNKKKAAIREHLLKKTLACSGRSVIVPAANIKKYPTQVGLPLSMIINLYKFQLEVLLYHMYKEKYSIKRGAFGKLLEVMVSNRNTFSSIVQNSSELLRLAADHGAQDQDSSVSKVYDIIYKAIKSYVEGSDKDGIPSCVVLVGRQPSLHEFSVRSFIPYIVKGRCIHLHTLTCKAYNADFDGDQMWVVGLLTAEAKKQALEKMSPMYGIINPKDSGVILSPEQDIKLGAYFATMLKNNVESLSMGGYYSFEGVKYYNSIQRINEDLDIGVLKTYDLVSLSNNGRRYLSTAGRILFNSIFPNGDGFTDEPFEDVLNFEGTVMSGKKFNKESYKALRFDGLVSGKPGRTNGMKYVVLPSITRWSFETYNPESNLDVFQKITEFGVRFSHESGVSIGIEDIVSSPSQEDNVKKVEEIFTRCDELYLIGVISNEARRETMEAVFKACMDASSKSLITSMPRNNNLFIMFDSNARGDEKQIMQSCGMIGMLQKSKTEILETPVITNYSKGLSSFDSMLLSFSTRMGVYSTQAETATSGELTREAANMTAGFVIVEHDCGCGCTPMKIHYSKKRDDMLTPDGRIVPADQLIGKKVLNNGSRTAKIVRKSCRDMIVDKDMLDRLSRQTAISIECEDGTYKLRYSMDVKSSSILLNRVTDDLSIKGLLSKAVGGTIQPVLTEKSIKFLEDNMFETVSVRTMLTCQSNKGACAKCYGMRYEKPFFPNIGDLVGLQAAQSVGEPAAQIQLSLFHKGGAAGESVSGGVSTIKNVLSSGHASHVIEAIISPVEGYFSQSKSDRLGMIVIETMDGKNYKIASPPERMLVRDGDYINVKDQITAGLRLPERLMFVTSVDQIMEAHFQLLEIYIKTFHENNIKLNGRHFEIISRAQVSVASVTESSDPNFSDGRNYDIRELLAVPEEERKFRIIGKVSKSEDVIAHFGGSILALVHEDFGSRLGSMVTMRSVYSNSSLITNIAVGEDITGTKKKEISPPKMRVVNRVMGNEPEQTSVNMHSVALSDNDDAVPDIESLFDMDKFYSIDATQVKPEVSASETYKDLEDMESLLSSMNLFGSEEPKTEDPEPQVALLEITPEPQEALAIPEEQNAISDSTELSFDDEIVDDDNKVEQDESDKPSDSDPHEAQIKKSGRMNLF